MIFVTVGSQMPFDRMVMAVDEWAAAQDSVSIFAQIGNSQVRPRAMEWVPLLDPEAYNERFLAAELIVSHVGMGTVISAMRHGKRLLMMPRRGDLRETRSDHQTATARWLADRPGIRVVTDEEMLIQALDDRESISSPTPLDEGVSSDLITGLRNFIWKI